MEKAKAIEILISHQEWRLGNIQNMPFTPKQITEATQILLNDADAQQSEFVKSLTEIYNSHKSKLTNLKENRSKAEEYKWTDAEIESCNSQITILAQILSDLNKLLIQYLRK